MRRVCGGSLQKKYGGERLAKRKVENGERGSVS